MPLHTTQARASTLPQTSFNSFSIHCPSLDKTPDVQIHHSETCRLPGKVSPPISETQLQISSHNCLTFLLYLSPWISCILHPADDAGSYTFFLSLRSLTISPFRSILVGTHKHICWNMLMCTHKKARPARKLRTRRAFLYFYFVFSAVFTSAFFVSSFLSIAWGAMTALYSTLPSFPLIWIGAEYLSFIP